MPRSTLTYRPTVLGSGVVQSRALSTYVALAASEHPRPPSLTRAFAALAFGGLLLLLSISLYGLMRYIAFACALALVGFGTSVGIRYGATTRFYASSEAHQEALLAEVLAKLNQDRGSVGLDATLNPAILAQLEQAAIHWERIEHIRSTAAWSTYSDLSQRAGKRSTALMNQALLAHVARPSAEIAILGADPLELLAELARAMDAANAELLSYGRIDDQPTGTPVPRVFPAHAQLEYLLDEATPPS